MSDTKTATGIRTEISERGDWVTFSIDAGGKYPVKLSTKKVDLIQKARAYDGIGVWTYTEKESDTINEHTGKPYVNRYLEDVTATELAAPGAEQPAHAPLRAGDKDRAITRMACLKAAAETVRKDGRGTEEDVALEVMKIADRYERWVYRDITDIPFD